MSILLNFFFYSGIIIPTCLALIDKFFDNDYIMFRRYVVLTITIYFIIFLYVISYFCVFRKVKFIKEMFEGSS